MASIIIKIEDRADGGMNIQFQADKLKTASTMHSNTAAQNAAILLATVLREHGLKAPDLKDEQSLNAWLTDQKRLSQAMAN